MYEFRKHIYVSSLWKMMEIFELLLLIVAKLLGEYSIKSILRIGSSIAYLFFNENNSIYFIEKS